MPPGSRSLPMNRPVEPARRAGYMAAMSAETLTAPHDAAPPIAAPPGPEAETLPILIAPHPALKAPSRPVGPADTERVRALLPRMFATMYRAPGIGLAAPQVEVGLRVAVVDLAPDNVRAPIALINPHVVAASEELATREEGCLSLPGQYADVTRPARVRVRYLDETGAKREIEADGLLAACLQHEIDHLDGVLFVDRISALKRNIILRKLAKEQRQKAR
jgi:peptide deformylase